ncbi:hypothetical protein D910_00266 [Dendroctonus ponderosae]|uniref:Uncharacterized protein n=1 Tax=Dendroctonus ponderosae TaxID=77166 RepID=U4UZH7_DENPD|nr:hypothetical protein D910_00266 [Dendroctonus ponderosae]
MPRLKVATTLHIETDDGGKHRNAKLGSVDVLKAVLTKYSDVNIQTEQGRTSFHPPTEPCRTCRNHAAHSGGPRGLQYMHARSVALRGQSVALRQRESDERGALQCKERPIAVSHPAAAQQRRSQRDQHGRQLTKLIGSRQQRTALMFAVSGNHKECVQVLLQCGADPNLVDADKHSCLFRAVRHQAVDLDRVVNGQDDIVQLLLASNAEVSARDVNGKTVLHLAGACGHLTCLQLILQYMKEADVVSRDNQDCTVLHWACYHGTAFA